MEMMDLNGEPVSNDSSRHELWVSHDCNTYMEFLTGWRVECEDIQTNF